MPATVLEHDSCRSAPLTTPSRLYLPCYSEVGRGWSGDGCCHSQAKVAICRLFSRRRGYSTVTAV